MSSRDGAMLSAGAPEIEVYEHGDFVDLLHPIRTTAALSVEGIARGLGYTCRYNGVGISRFYSVAEHAVLVHDLVRWQGLPARLCTAGLWHDAAEAYLGDLTAPLKWALRRETIEMDAHYHGPWPPDVAGHRSAYDRLSERMDAAILGRFQHLVDVDLEAPEVRTADLWALKIEAAALTATRGRGWRALGDLPNGGELPADVVWNGGLTPDAARLLWLRCATEDATSRGEASS